MRILVIEDDHSIGEQLAKTLTKEGYAVEWVRDGEAGVETALQHPYGLILLDLMLPKRDGWQVCQDLRRARSEVPILMLTARGEVSDRVRGLDMGADDYLPKPFDFQELLARIRALTRRDKVAKAGRIQVGDLVVDMNARTVSRDGLALHLTPREYSLFEALVRNAGRTLTREAIIERIWGDDTSMSNTVNFHVTSLRKKIDTGEGPSLIETVHGFGYRLRTAENAE